MNHNILITGGVGFIGSHVVRFFVNKYPNYHIYNLDILSYASNDDNLIEIKNKKNYTFIKGDICDNNLVKDIFNRYKISRVIHLAAETHVDRSIDDPLKFAKVNTLGTSNLLQAATDYWKNNYSNKLFYHISTDEVYGSLGKQGLFLETSKYDPNSPYSASKASSDHFVRSYKNTYSLPIVISNCSNNFGPNQFPEKLIPLVIKNIINKKSIPVYGNGENIRDWIYVDDHVRAIDLIFHKGQIGDTYNIGGSNEYKNIDLIHELINITDSLLERCKGTSLELINFVPDRPGHDFRYAIDSSKLKNQLGWEASKDFLGNIKKTVSWYIEEFN
ncbi:MAG: dTDP-glucose 4,6-dehydratase [Halobacteriovoraceae bacterium]|nr:dTDP-glucose 4,6-dehydratase [Halobacteriovoraceae bacterium]